MKTLKQIWNFIWHDNSIWSWIVNIILALVIVRFLIYPGLGLAFSTTHPLVAVVSSSMEHGSNFDTWWENNKGFYSNQGFTKQQFKKFSFHNGFNKGDIMVLFGSKEINLGDVIVYNAQYKNPIIHRVIHKESINNREYYTTKGDHNKAADNQKVNKVIGRAVFRIPYLGWVKIIFTKLVGWL